MTGRPYILAETNWKSVAHANYTLAVLPWGATEAHNYHLPYGTDCMQCDHVAALGAARAWNAGARVVVLPTVPFGVQTGQLDIPLCLNMNPSTQAALLRDIATSLAGQGIQKLVILNGHGGNEFRSIVRELQPHVRTFLSVVNWYRIVEPRPYFAEPGDHAGELETSVMQHIAPSLVLPVSDAGDGAERKFRIAAFREGWAWAPRQWRQASADTGIGNPRQASPAKGARYLEEVVARFATFLIELASADPGNLYERSTD
jgi:creatinine amidohydrolase